MNSKPKQNVIFLLTLVVLVAAVANNAALAQWTAEVVDSEGDVGFSKDLAYDPAGNPGIAYSDSSNDLVKFAHWNGASWEIETVGAASVDFGISLAYDTGGIGEGNATVSYVNGGLYFARRSQSGEWVSQLVEGQARSYDTSLAYDHSGNPSISYVGYVSTHKNPKFLSPYLKFAHWDGASWDIQNVDEGGSHNSLSYDFAGNPAIAYSGGGTLKFARWNEDSSSWDIEIVETGAGFGMFACLAFDPTTRYPSIVHTHNPVRFARWNGGSWEFEEIVGIYSYPSLAYNLAGTPFVSYGDIYDDSYVLKVAQRYGSSWETETVDWALIASHTSIAIDPDGNPAVGYEDLTTYYDGVLMFAWLGSSFNARPTVAITIPADGSPFPFGDTTVPIDFAGMAYDREESDLTAYLTWTSDIKGPIGSGGNFSTTLNAGRHIITASVTDSGGRTGSDSVSIIVGQPTTPTIYVEDIAMNSDKAGKNYYALATVWIVDDYIADVEGATVYGQWSDAVSGTASGVTDADGKVTLQSPKKKNGGTFIFTVTNVVASGYTYDEALNAETEDSITVP